MSNCNTCPSNGSCGKDQSTCTVKSNPNSDIKHIVAIMSGKGGVGKSSTTALLAKQFRKKGFKVGILDADITGPSIPRLMGTSHEKAYGSEKGIEPVIDKDGIKLISLNLLMEDENQPVVWRGPIVGNAVIQFYTDVLWGDLDYLFIDMPPGTGDVALTIMQNIPVSGVVMVSTPQPMVSMIVSKAINMCKQMNIKVYGIVENMSYIICPDCDKHITLYPHNDTQNLLEQQNLPLLCKLPMMEGIASIDLDDNFAQPQIDTLDELMNPCVDALLKLIK